MALFPAPLRQRGFFTLWISQVISYVGDRLYEIALIWLIYDQTGDPLAVAAVTFASVASAAVATVPASAVVDRVDRRLLLIASHLLRGGAVLAVPLVGVGASPLPLLVAVAVVNGIGEAFFGPAKNAIIPELVPSDQFDAANSISYITQNGGQVLYAVGGVVVGALGAIGAFTANAVTFFLAAGVLLAMPRANERRTAVNDGENETTGASAIRRALGVVRSNEYLPSILLMSLVTSFAVAPIGVVIPFYVESIATATSFVFGVTYAAFFVGMFVGGIGLNAVDLRLSRGRQITAGTVLSGAALVLMAIVPPYVPFSLAVASVLFLGSGVATILVKVPIRTYVQQAVDDEDLGKVLALLNLSMLVAPPVSIAATGALLDVVGPITVLGLIGGTVTVAGLAMVVTPLWKSPDPAV